MPFEKTPGTIGIFSDAVKNAIEAKKATRQEGKCSLCGEKARAGNFCEKCGATFLTDKQIEEWGKQNPLQAKKIGYDQAQQARVFKHLE